MFITVDVSVGDDRYLRTSTSERIQIEVPDKLLELIRPQLSVMINEVANKVLDLGIEKLNATTVAPDQG